jgi:hypothetical protein
LEVTTLREEERYRQARSTLLDVDRAVNSTRAVKTGPGGWSELFAPANSAAPCQSKKWELYMAQNRRPDGAKRIHRAHAASKPDFLGTNGLGRRVFDEIVSALGFAFE